MKIRNFNLIVTMALLGWAFSLAAQTKRISPDQFESGIKVREVQLVDVRTPEEYKEKHISNALNMNINGSDFQAQLASLDKNKPVYVYCLAGPRSSNAAKIMKEKGFKEVYELDGGINKWIANRKPVEKSENSTAKGTTLNQLSEMTKVNKLVIVDFNAQWCGPCKKMKPHLDKVAKEQASIVSVVAVDADASQELIEHYKVEALPTLLFFKNSKQLLRHEGYLDEAGINELVKKYK